MTVITQNKGLITPLITTMNLQVGPSNRGQGFGLAVSGVPDVLDVYAIEVIIQLLGRLILNRGLGTCFVIRLGPTLTGFAVVFEACHEDCTFPGRQGTQYLENLVCFSRGSISLHN